MDFFDFFEKWISRKLCFFFVDVFFVIGFGTGMVSGAFSNFGIENRILKRRVIFSSVFSLFSKKLKNYSFLAFLLAKYFFVACFVAKI